MTIRYKDLFELEVDLTLEDLSNIIDKKIEKGQEQDKVLYNKICAFTDKTPNKIKVSLLDKYTKNLDELNSYSTSSFLILMHITKDLI